MIYLCPVCNGKGLVPNGFYNVGTNEHYSSNCSPETCRSCNGKGYINEKDENFDVPNIMFQEDNNLYRYIY